MPPVSGKAASVCPPDDDDDDDDAGVERR